MKFLSDARAWSDLSLLPMQEAMMVGGLHYRSITKEVSSVTTMIVFK